MKNTKKTIFNLMLSTVFALALFACNSKKTDDSKEIAENQNEAKFEDTKIEDDTEFAVTAADGGMLEVELGKLAQTHASLAQVKQFGQTMVDEHSKANEELKALAQQKNISLPDSLGEKSKKKYDELAEKTGADFDDAYTDFMVKDHKEDIDDFKKEADKGKDTDVKMWASGKVPTLEHHLEMAKQAEDAVDKHDKK